MQRLIFSFLLGLFCLPTLADSVITIENGWVREGPPTARVLAGFMVINNSSDTDVDITHVESEDFESVEMHRTVIEDGVASMIAQNSLTIPAGGELVLEPGSYHLMLIGAKRTLKAGDSVTITLSRDTGYCIEHTLIVKKGGDNDMGDHDHHHHHH